MCGAVLTSQNRQAETRSLFEKARLEYRPSKTRLLIIAESPPSSGGFFYFPKTIGKDHLFRETMKTIGLWPQSAQMPRGVDKNPLLRSFQSMGFYLLDASTNPVNQMPNRARREAIRAQLPRLMEDVKRAEPFNMVIVKSSIFGHVRSALEEAGFGSRVLNNRPIPFPSHGNQQKYRSMMKRLLDRAGLL
jgi:hypothetical protein